jgi:hypothetical protein
MCRKKDVTEEHGAFAYAANGHEEEKLKGVRAETWRAMEDAVLSASAEPLAFQTSQ